MSEQKQYLEKPIKQHNVFYTKNVELVIDLGIRGPSIGEQPT